MKLTWTLSLLPLLGCASNASAPRAPVAESRSCGSLAPELLLRNSDVFAAPDSTSNVVASVRSDTPVCAAMENAGFGFRLVRLADGKTGYVHDDGLVVR
jgi:hypothetical protein